VITACHPSCPLAILGSTSSIHAGSERNQKTRASPRSKRARPGLFCFSLVGLCTARVGLDLPPCYIRQPYPSSRPSCSSGAVNGHVVSLSEEPAVGLRRRVYGESLVVDFRGEKIVGWEKGNAKAGGNKAARRSRSLRGLASSLDKLLDESREAIFQTRCLIRVFKKRCTTSRYTLTFRFCVRHGTEHDGIPG
jgi:hypothetical protein